MDWNSSPPGERIKWLLKRREDIRRAKALLDAFEASTDNFIDRLKKKTTDK
jgi:hypothetical protein